MALILSVAALAAAGCGSSKSSKSNGATAAQAPTTALTPNTTTTSGLTLSTPIDAPQAKAAISAGIQKGAQNKIPQNELGPVTDCAIKKLKAQGVKTLGQLAGFKGGRQIGMQCAQELHITLK